MSEITDALAALARIEKRQLAYEDVVRRVLAVQQIHTEKLDAILEAATVEQGPSPVAELLKEIVEALRMQLEALQTLPGVLAEAIREENERAMMPDADDGDPEFAEQHP